MGGYMDASAPNMSKSQVCPVSSSIIDVRASIIIGGPSRMPEIDQWKNLRIGVSMDGDFADIFDCLTIIRHSIGTCQRRIFYVIDWTYVPIDVLRWGRFWLPAIAGTRDFVARSSGFVFLHALFGMLNTNSFRWRLSWETPIPITPRCYLVAPQYEQYTECGHRWAINNLHTCWRPLWYKDKFLENIRDINALAQSVYDRKGTISVNAIIDASGTPLSFPTYSAAYHIGRAWKQLCFSLAFVGIQRPDVDTHLLRFAEAVALQKREYERYHSRERPTRAKLPSPITGGLVGLLDSIARMFA